jgi:ribosomal protein S18 acetylase RimI-like enzyme
MTDSTEEFFAHFGIRGMKWGVVRNNYREIRDTPGERLDLVTDKGRSVTLKENRRPPIPAALGSISERSRNNMNKSRSFVIEVDGKDVGESAIRETSKTELNLEWLGVRPEYRGQGYGSSVFGAGVAYAKEKGYSKLVLEVPGDSPDARHIYEKFGFKATDKKFEDEEAWGGLTEMVYDVSKKRGV